MSKAQEGPQIEAQSPANESTVEIGAQDNLAALLDSPQENEPNDQTQDSDKATADSGDGEKGADKDAGEAEKPAGTGSTELDKTPGTSESEALKQEISVLRGITRNQRLQIAMAAEKTDALERQIRELAAAGKQQKSKGLDDFDDESQSDAAASAAARQKSETVDQPTSSVLQELQNNLNHISETRGGLIATIAETMQLNPAYTDLSTVCSKSNFADIVDMVAEDFASEQNIPVAEAQLRVELAVWSKPNPYKFMYEMIKKYHPTYAASGAGEQKSVSEDRTPNPAQSGKQSPAQKAAGGAPKSVDAPSTIVNVPSGSIDQGGWTAERIDKLAEEDLNTVPAAVYKLYMSGDLK